MSALNDKNLTPKPAQRQNCGVNYCLFGPFSMLILFAGMASASDFQPLQSISATAEKFVAGHADSTDQRIRPSAGHLDPRLKLPRCDQKLQAYLANGGTIGQRTTVGVRCAGSRPWKVYVPVTVAIHETVLVALQSLPRGHVMGRDDVKEAARDISTLHYGYVRNIDGLTGQRLKRPIMAGAIITPAVLEAKTVIRRGQGVTLIVSNPAISIRVAGKALADGAMNQRIRVENSGSGQVVEGIVRSPQIVEILTR